MSIQRRPDPRAVGGVLFAVFFVAGDVARRVLAEGQVPLPGAPASDVVRYNAENASAVLTIGSLQVLSALSLLVFTGAVAAFTRRVADRRALPVVATAGAAVAGAALLVSALLSLSLGVWAQSWSLDTVSAVRTANFLTGGVVHVVSLGLAAGACTLAATRARALPRGVRWVGYVAAVPSVLSVLSVPVYYASIFLPVGRILAFVWCIALGITLLVGSRRSAAEPATV